MNIVHLTKNKQKISERLNRCTNFKLRERLVEELRFISANIQSYIYMNKNSRRIEAKFLLEVASRSTNSIDLLSQTELRHQ